MRPALVIVFGLIVVSLSAAPAPVPKAPIPSWPMFGGSPARNMVSTTATAYSHVFPVDIDDEKTRVLGNRIKWRAALGGFTSPQPVIVGDRVLIGTNNENPRNNRDFAARNAPRDMGVLMCFRASDGTFLWQAVTDMLEAGQVNDWPRTGVCSTPVVEDNRVYYVSNRCEVVCLDLDGFANGNDGFQDEKYREKTDADIIWSFDMISELNVLPHNKAACAPLIAGNLLFVVTGNGVDENHKNVPFPDAPSFICLNKKTGKLVWQSGLPGKNIMHGQWSNPAYGLIKGKPQVIFPGGDGWLYSFDPPTGKLIWKLDANPKDSKYEIGGKGTRSDFIGSPVIYKERVFIGVGQDPEHLEGVGHFWCIDPAGKSGDISSELVTENAIDPPKTNANSNSGVVWHYGGVEKSPFAKRDFVFGRTMSTACIVDDVLYIAELAGYVHCLDAKTGKRFWQWDTKANIWGSCFYADGKVLLANEDGDIYIFKHEKNPDVIDEVAIASAAAVEAANKAKSAGEDAAAVRKAGRDARDKAVAAARERVKAKYLLQVVETGESMKSTPIVVGDTIYVATDRALFAISNK